MTDARDLAEIAALRAILAAKPRPAGFPQRRQRIEEVGAHWPVAPDIALTPARIGPCAAEWSLAPGADPARVMLFLHGGGYCSGSLVSHRRLATEAGRAAGMRALALDYRLAPEHPFPAALEDARAAWDFLRAAGIAPGAMALAGDSAGGGLSLALAAQLRDAGEPGPGALWLLSPWTDLTVSGASIAAKDAEDPLCHRAYLEELGAAYRGGTDARDPRVSPLFAAQARLPPTLIQVGSAETLLDDSVRLAGALGAAAVPVRLEIWPHMIHAFPLWNAGLDAGRRALANGGAWLRGVLAG
jgi:acetyl esterase/lipase